MRAVDIIIKKRDRQILSREEIEYFVQGYTKGEIADYQAAAWSMAVLLNGMTEQETTDLTLAMANSGVVLDLSEVVSIVVDKHSTGGVGDKTTLVVEPVVASCGLPVGKMSGRGLGFSGGTLDKMEAIAGYRTDLTTNEFITQLRQVGLVLTGQSADLAPADGKFYALRDVTGTVQSIPLIASSIMSKKIAAGAQAIILDVKVGLGAFMENIDQARQLSLLMVEIARLAGRKAVAILSDMNQPLGNAVGNALEVKEAIETLRGGGPEDFREHCLVIAGHMLALGGKVNSAEEGREIALKALMRGDGLDMLRRLVAAQGGDAGLIDHPEKLPKAPMIETLRADRDGYLSCIHARLVGETAVALGAGRTQKNDPIDHAVGIIVHRKVGDAIHVGDALFSVHARTEAQIEAARESLSAALVWSDIPIDPLPLFYGVISS